MSPLEDQASVEALVQRAKANDFAAFEELADRYERRIYSFALKMLRQVQDAEDVTQQAFLSALENIQRFRGDSSFLTWLLRIATHAALKVIRKRRGSQMVSLDVDAEDDGAYGAISHPEYIADWRDSPETLVPRREMSALLDSALGQLDDKHRSVFLLRDVEGLSIRETAEALGITEANTKVRLLRARLQLREILTREFGDPATRIEAIAH